MALANALPSNAEKTIAPSATDIRQHADARAGQDWAALERRTCFQMMRRYLAVLTAPYREAREHSGFLEFRALDLSGKRTPLRYWLNLARYGEAERELHVSKALYQWADNCNRDGRDIFVGVLPRSEQSGKAASVTYAGFFWADLDFKIAGEAAVWQAIDAYSEAPDLLVLTGGGAHVYYRLRQLVHFPGDVPQARFCDKLRRFQQDLLPGCDLVADAPHLLRVPGFRNRKPERGDRLVSLSPLRAPDAGSA